MECAIAFKRAKDGSIYGFSVAAWTDTPEVSRPIAIRLIGKGREIPIMAMHIPLNGGSCEWECDLQSFLVERDPGDIKAQYEDRPGLWLDCADHSSISS